MRGEVFKEWEEDGFHLTARKIDYEDPDLSYLGSWQERPGREPFAVDLGGRSAPETDEHGRDIEYPAVVDGRGRVVRGLDSLYHPRDWSASHSYRYFVPGMVQGELDGLTYEKVRRMSYARRRKAFAHFLSNYERFRTYGDEWACVGVRVTVERAGVVLAESCGLWGIETDSDPAYFEEVAKDEACEALTTALETLAKLTAPQTPANPEALPTPATNPDSTKP